MNVKLEIKIDFFFHFQFFSLDSITCHLLENVAVRQVLFGTMTIWNAESIEVAKSIVEVVAIQELVLTLDTNLPKQQKSLQKKFLKGLILILTRGIETGKLMDIFV